jgi:hypothetical protein
METLGNQKLQKSCNFLICEICDYSTCRKSSYDKHLLTSKHEKQASGNVMETKSCKKLQKVAHISYCCENCNKNFTNRSGLWKHTQKCIVTNEKEHTDKDLIMMLIKENSELKNMMMKVLENGTNNVTHTNSHNKAFNLNFFLNETCKDAMNITDFVNSIELQLGDLERVGELGYVEGISNIIVKNLKELDITQRPVHCTDKKRETMYVKDENTWEKDEEKKKMHKLVKKVADKNMRLLPAYREKHPDYIKASSICSDKYNQMFLESLGGSGDNNFEKEEKIIQKVSREVFVQKDT